MTVLTVQTICSFCGKSNNVVPQRKVMFTCFHCEKVIAYTITKKVNGNYDIKPINQNDWDRY